MPDLLGVTNPVPGQDIGAHNRNAPSTTANNLQVNNVPELNRVTRGDGKTDQHDAASEKPRFDSNYQTFLERLRQNPNLANEFTALLRRGAGTHVSSQLKEGSAAALAEFLSMLRMDPSALKTMLLQQLRDGNRFGGEFFSLLRQAYAQSDSEGVKQEILQFLKRYNDYSATSHLESALTRNIAEAARSIPARYGSELMTLLAKLQNSMSAGDRSGALMQLRQNIMPYLSDYVSSTHDLGAVRQAISLITLDISRYENGSLDGLLQAFRFLKAMPFLSDTLSQVDERSFLFSLQNSGFVKSSEENLFANHLANLTRSALGGNQGSELQTLFQNLTLSFLLNESVYMPLGHMILPMQWEERQMFSELWVDPNAEQGGGVSREKGQRFLLKIDIEPIGFFDIVLGCFGKNVDLSVFCPERLLPYKEPMEKSFSQILTQNGLSVQSMHVGKLDRSLSLTEVFPKLFERKDSVNVKV